MESTKPSIWERIPILERGEEGDNALGVLPYGKSRALRGCSEYGPPAGSCQRLESQALVVQRRRALSNQNYRPTQAQKGVTTVFQKGFRSLRNIRNESHV